MIKVTTGYRGKPSNEQFIAPGEYEVGSDRLFGLERYLVQNGFAVFIGNDLLPEAEAEVEDGLEERTDLEPIIVRHEAPPKGRRR